VLLTWCVHCLGWRAAAESPGYVCWQRVHVMYLQEFMDAVVQAYKHGIIACVHNACDSGICRTVRIVLMDQKLVVSQWQYLYHRMLCSMAMG
jgi:hypothetical protein